MRLRTGLVVLAVLAGLLGAAAVGLGVFGDSGAALEAQWVSDTGRDVSANHHAVAAGRNGGAVVYAPVSGRSDTSQCGLYALDGGDGTTDWTHRVPARNCTIHSVADPTVADFDDDGTAEVLTATTERAVIAFHPTTGAIEFRHNLSSYGYTKPLVTDFTGDGDTEIVVVDARGSVYVLRPDGSVVWTEQLDQYAWGQPSVADFDGDGDPELAVGVGGDGGVQVFERNGAVAWHRADAVEGSISWMTAGQADDDAVIEVVTATAGGTVTAFDGANGEVEWSRDFGRFAAVHAFGDGDGDGDPEVYATARDGKLRSLDAASGEIEWTTALSTGDVQMTPPPALGDIDGDGAPEVVAASNDGAVAVVDPESGEVVARYERDAPIYTYPVLEDVDGDGRQEILMMYGDGRVVALS